MGKILFLQRIQHLNHQQTRRTVRRARTSPIKWLVTLPANIRHTSLIDGLVTSPINNGHGPRLSTNTTLQTSTTRHSLTYGCAIPRTHRSPTNRHNCCPLNSLSPCHATYAMSCSLMDTIPLSDVHNTSPTDGHIARPRLMFHLARSYLFPKHVALIQTELFISNYLITFKITILYSRNYFFDFTTRLCMPPAALPSNPSVFGIS
jgi:hypothetical protein